MSVAEVEGRGFEHKSLETCYVAGGLVECLIEHDVSTDS